MRGEIIRTAGSRQLSNFRIGGPDDPVRMVCLRECVFLLARTTNARGKPRLTSKILPMRQASPDSRAADAADYGKDEKFQNWASLLMQQIKQRSTMGSDVWR